MKTPWLKTRLIEDYEGEFRIWEMRRFLTKREAVAEASGMSVYNSAVFGRSITYPLASGGRVIRVVVISPTVLSPVERHELQAWSDREASDPGFLLLSKRHWSSPAVPYSNPVV